MNRSLKTSKKSIITYITSAILLFFLVHTFVSNRITIVDRVFSIIVVPFLSAYHYCISPFKEKYTHYKEYQKLVEERDFYKKSYTTLHERHIQNLATKGFDQRTAKLEKFSKRYLSNNSILCKILLHRISNNEQVILVNSGSRHGVTSDMIATYGSCLIGRVIEIFPYYSIVQLITDKRSRISVYCAKTHAKGIVEGENKNNELRLSYVDCLQPLQENDLLISAGEGTVFPEGFGIGTIASYEQQDLHYNVTVTPCYDFQTLEYCYLIPYEQCAYSPLVKS